jgi:L-2-hydroxyglutarate oxidase LhgO
MARFDLVIAGAGIVGLAHALAAARRGLRVAVFERDARAAAASVRNFGFVTITGQDDGVTRERALRSRDVWEEVAAAAGIAVHQRGALVAARRPAAMQVLEEFAAGPMGRGCALLDAGQARARLPRLHPAIVRRSSSQEAAAHEGHTRVARWLRTAMSCSHGRRRWRRWRNVRMRRRSPRMRVPRPGRGRGVARACKRVACATAACR